MPHRSHVVGHWDALGGAAGDQREILAADEHAAAVAQVLHCLVRAGPRLLAVPGIGARERCRNADPNLRAGL